MFNLFKSRAQKIAEAEAEEKRLAAAVAAREKAEADAKNRKILLKENYETVRREYGYHKGHNGVVTLQSKKYYAFAHDDELRLFICQPENWELPGKKIPQWQRRAIKLSRIKYFKHAGDAYTETKISGGGTKQANISDVAIASVVAGATGAIIASRPKTQSIKSETIRHDNRKTILVYDNGNLEFDYKDYDIFMKLMPDKEFYAVQQTRILEKAKKQDDSIELLRKLKIMLVENLITQEEYDSKKEEILRRM